MNTHGDAVLPTHLARDMTRVHATCMHLPKHPELPPNLYGHKIAPQPTTWHECGASLALLHAESKLRLYWFREES